MNAPENRVYEFGPFRLNPAEGVLLREGRQVPLTPKAYEILLCLLHHAGHILDKEALMQEIWPDTFVEEGNLKVNISALRKVLGDTTEEAAFIETIPRRGYRFVAKLRVVEAVPSVFVPAGPSQVTIERRKFERRVTEEEEELVETPENGGGSAYALPGTALPALPAALNPARRAWPAWAAGIAVLAVLLAGTGWWQAHRPGEPVRVSLVSDRITAWDSKGRIVWEYVLPEPAEIQPVQGCEGVAFQDLIGDGHRELLVLANSLPRTPAVASSQQLNSVLFKRAVLYCFSDRGKLLWTYSPEAIKLSFNGRLFEGPWRALAMLFTPREQGKYIWISFMHNTWWPSFVMRIDARGGATMAFLNSGALGSLAYVRNTSGGYVIAAGTNNGYGSATVAIFGENDPTTASAQAGGTPYVYDQWTGGPYMQFVFPRSELFDMSGESFHIAMAVQLTGERIQIQTNEGKDPNGFAPFLLGFYELSPDFKLLSASFSDTYWTLHRQREQEGKIHHTAEQCPDRKIAGRVRLWLAHRGWTVPEPPIVQAPN